MSGDRRLINNKLKAGAEAPALFIQADIKVTVHSFLPSAAGIFSVKTFQKRIYIL